MISIDEVYFQHGYSGHDHLGPRPEIDRQSFRSSADALRYYRRRYPGWYLGIEYRRADGSRWRYGPRTDGRVHEGVYVRQRLIDPKTGDDR